MARSMLLFRGMKFQSSARVLFNLNLGRRSGLLRRTDETRSLCFPSLPRGTYESIRLACRTRHLAKQNRKPLVIDIDDKDGGAGCQVDIFLPSLWSISGTVLDTRHGRSGLFHNPACRSEGSRDSKTPRRNPCRDTEDGHFSLPQLPPGRYRLKFHPKVGEKS